MARWNEADTETAAAVARVVHAEREAREAVARCELDSQALTRQSRARAAETLKRADARNAFTRASVAAKVGAAVVRPGAEGAALCGGACGTSHWQCSSCAR